VLSTWDAQLGNPTPFGVGNLGMGCIDCGGTCTKPKNGVSGLLEDLSPFTSLLVHLVMAGLAISLFRYVFLSPESGYGKRRADMARTGKRLAQAQAQHTTARARPRLRPGPFAGN